MMDPKMKRSRESKENKLKHTALFKFYNHVFGTSYNCRISLSSVSLYELYQPYHVFNSNTRLSC